MITVLFDTETTGLLEPSVNDISKQPYIVEFYAVKIDDQFNVLGEFETYLKPPIPIPPETSRIHGIDDAKVASSPAFADVVDDLCNFFVGVHNIVAHNLPYDRSMLANELLRCDKLLNFPWPPNHICTVEKTKWIEQRRMNLANLHTFCTGKPHENAHTAKADVFALVRCYHHLKETYPERF